jgi:glycosyltransferase involved in cell wall biosynthesis
VDHGVDVELFERAASRSDLPPADVERIPRPRIGFVGGIDDHTFDSDLFESVARSLPDLSFVLVGASSIDRPWRRLPNVHLLGRRPYAEVPAYMAACDVLIMPWKSNSWIEACNPVKLKEYLAAGKPVVSTWFPQLAAYEGCVTVARDDAGFSRAIREALRHPPEPKKLRDRVRSDSWDSRAERILETLAEVGVRPAEMRRPESARSPEPSRDPSRVPSGLAR